MLIVSFPGGGHLSIEFTSDAADDEHPPLCASLEQRAASRATAFRQLVQARIIELSSKLDSLRLLEEVGVQPPWYATVKRLLPVYAKTSRRWAPH